MLIGATNERKTMKKIMMLGGNYVQMTATLAAKSQGYYVISVDYLPNNPAHRFADEYYNVSTIDKEAVLELAKKLNIDGIVSYASDVSAPTAAYVAESMRLPTNPYKSVHILTHKNEFRRFMQDTGFPMPKGSTFKTLNEALLFFQSLGSPVMIKPVDSSGSKGVFLCQTEQELINRWDESMQYSLEKSIIVEEFIKKKGYQIDGDIFMIDGEIVFWGICDQHHDMELAPYVPIGLSYPSTQPQHIQEKAFLQVKEILSRLKMTMGAYNVEYIVGQNDQVYILEIGPRNGGNFIPNVIKAATGYDMATLTVRQAVGDDCSHLQKWKLEKPVSSYNIHSHKDGVFDGLDISKELEGHIIDTLMYEEQGVQVKKFHNSCDSLGICLITYNNVNELCEKIDNMNNYIKVVVK